MEPEVWFVPVVVVVAVGASGLDQGVTQVEELLRCLSVESQPMRTGYLEIAGHRLQVCVGSVCDPECLGDLLGDCRL